MNNFIFVAIFIALFHSTLLFSQKKEISIVAENQTIEFVLNKLSYQTGYAFSYNSTLIDVTKKVTVNIKQATIEDCLDFIFEKKVSYKIKSNYIILLPSKKKKNEVYKTSKSDKIFLVGQVYDMESKNKIYGVSIYEKNMLTSSVSDINGRFKIVLPSLNSLQLYVSKENYQDTSLLLTFPYNGNEVLFFLRPKKAVEDTTALIKDTLKTINKLENIKVEEISFLDQLLSRKTRAHIKNLKDTLFAKTQVSLLPFLSTKGSLVANTSNDYSFNIISGYTKGTKKIEIGTLLNIDRGDVKYFQLCGGVNVVGGSVLGMQVAGLANINIKKTNALQMAMFSNINTDSTKGMQLSGIANIQLRNLEGMQGTFGINTTIGNVRGLQIAYLGNQVFKGNIHGIQLAGGYNLSAKKMKGLQSAFFLNMALDTIKGLQMAMGVNYSRKEVKGVQVASLNYSKSVKGMQIGLLNLSDTCPGIPLGLISYVRKGYRKFEVFADELFYTNLAFTTGVNKLHNVFTFGFNSSLRNYFLFNVGYGLGSNMPISKRWNIASTITYNYIFSLLLDNAPSNLYKIHIGIERKVKSNFSICIGPTLNGYFSDYNSSQYNEVYSNLSPHNFYTQLYSSGLSIQSWLGARISIKF